MTLKSIIKNQIIKADLKLEHYNQKMKELTSLESKDERMERRVKIEYLFFIGLFISLILGIICLLISFSIPAPSYLPSTRVNLVSDPQWVFYSYSIFIILSPLFLILLYVFIIRFKTYQCLKQRYIEKFGSKPKIKAFDYLFNH